VKKRIIPIFIPELGCPFRCIYCNQFKITNTTSELSFSSIYEQIKKGISLNSNNKLEVAFYGGNFTAIDKRIQFELLKIAQSFYEVESIRISTRPDYINESILTFLKENNVKTIELGIQSMCEDVLLACKRGHSVYDSIKAMELINQFGFLLGVQIMIGLPNSSFEKDIYTSYEVMKFRPQFARIYPTLVIKDTYLEKMYLEGRYKPLSLEEAIALSSTIKEAFLSNNINVIRVGLQASESINLNKEVIAGPFHPSFGELVDSEIIFKKIRESLAQLKDSLLILEVNPKILSKVIGIRKINKKRIENEFQCSLEIKVNEQINDEIIILYYNGQKMMLYLKL